MKEIIKGITWLLGLGLDCNVFIIESKDEKLMIDSGLGGGVASAFGTNVNSNKILNKVIVEKKIENIFLTHSHIDHVGGVLSLQDKYDFNIITSEIEAQHLETGDSAYIEPFLGSKCPPLKVSKKLKEGAILEVGDFSFEVLLTPGHTHGSCSLWESDKKILISGDTVFPQGSFGRTDLSTGSSKDLLASLKRLARLKLRILLPGHMNPIISAPESPLNSIKQSYQNAKMMLADF